MQSIDHICSSDAKPERVPWHSDCKASFVKWGSFQGTIGKTSKHSQKNGVVTLTGEASSQSERIRTQAVAAAVPNVLQVVNELQVKNQKATSSKWTLAQPPKDEYKHKYLQQFRFDAKFASWLSRIVVNHCRMRLRKMRQNLLSLDEPRGRTENRPPARVQGRSYSRNKANACDLARCASACRC